MFGTSDSLVVRTASFMAPLISLQDTILGRAIMPELQEKANELTARMLQKGCIGYVLVP